ncbi:hypothetical protein SARI_02934 [Salmonella enterica subsp. arizonae serovar 62:z4,z23:-]|uniref:Uncharacterized protein n=1 Tax=Salmonella arizonae (strain ATCC BAA-731 / CDC346-86 / RSK2980) TaxID=41514 RepID=A9MR32_SALAR|nr:hypothetical protein SARI_02934 [Salmonella enterica subsp. arizonae serovar 62:z4,z23:-]
MDNENGQLLVQTGESALNITLKQVPENYLSVKRLTACSFYWLTCFR